MLILFGFFFLLLAFGVPVATSIGLSAIASLWYFDYPLIVIAQKMITGIDSFTFIAIPLFILSGELMNIGKITDRIFNFAKAVVGWIPGGLAHANVLGSLIFAGMSGSAIADAGGLGTVELKAMKEDGYEDYFSGAVTAASSTIGPIFPPSIPFVIYGGIASVSVGKLFLGGVVPGLLMTLSLDVIVYLYAVKRGYKGIRFSFGNLGKEFVRALIPLMTPVIILSGFITGFFTPTEASAVAVVYALLVGVFVYHEIDWKLFRQALANTAATTANVVFIIGSATLFSYILTNQGFSKAILEFIVNFSTSKWVILLLVHAILFVLGLIMEPGAILIMMLPILLPIVEKLQFDYVYFGVTMIMNLMIGQITPPFGMCLFTVAQVGRLRVESLAKATIPFIIPLVVVLLFCLFVPATVTWLPTLLMD